MSSRGFLFTTSSPCATGRITREFRVLWERREELIKNKIAALNQSEIIGDWWKGYQKDSRISQHSPIGTSKRKETQLSLGDFTAKTKHSREKYPQLRRLKPFWASVSWSFQSNYSDHTHILHEKYRLKMEREKLVCSTNALSYVYTEKSSLDSCQPVFGLTRFYPQACQKKRGSCGQ